MYSDLAWNLMAELFVSCSLGDIDSDFRRAEKQVQEIVDRTGLSHAQRHRLHADVVKAAMHGFGQIARTGDCVYINIQMYIKETGFGEDDRDLPDNSTVEIVGTKNRLLLTEQVSKTFRESGWGYFLIERVADRQESSPAALSYIIEIFLYREG